MSRYRLASAAEADLAGIFWQGLERFGPIQTERYLEEIEAPFDMLAQFPEVARLRQELSPPVRALPHSAHIIVYHVETDGIVILRIRSAGENWTATPSGDES